MPLIDLKTNLKSLKYGNDRPGGGNSGQPYITNDINNPKNRLGFDDGLVRGGAVGALKASINDTARIGKFLTDLPQGPLFIVKQVGLQLSNPKLESRAPKTGIGFIDRLATALNDKIGIGPTRIYNLGINTLAQIPVNAFGIHFNRHGLLPVQDDTTKYLSVAQNNNQSTGTNSARIAPNSTNRLLKYAAKLLPAAPPQSKPPGVIDQLLSLIPGASLFIKPQQQTIDSYIGGPGSVYGIGKTFIKRYDYTSNGVNKQQPQDKGKVNYPSLLGVSKLYFAAGTGLFAGVFPDRDTAAKNGMDLSNPTKAPAQINQTAVTYTNPSIKKYANLRKQVDSQSTGSIFGFNPFKNTNLGMGTGLLGSGDLYNGVIQSYTDKKISYNNGIDAPITISGSWKTKNREVRVGSGRKDSINLTPIFSTNTGTIGDKPPINIPNADVQTINDLVKFRIQAIDSTDPNKSDWMIFRAYLTQFSDSVDATWNDIKYVGRGDKFYVYDGFTRKINIGFKVAALSAVEMEPMYQKLNFLMGNLMPDYNNNLMRGPLVKMTVGNWIDGQPGILNNISYTIPQDSPWEIGLGDKYLILPHVLEVSMTFTPIGSQTQKVNKVPSKSQNTSHIAQNYNGDNNREPNYIKP